MIENQFIEVNKKSKMKSCLKYQKLKINLKKQKMKMKPKKKKQFIEKLSKKVQKNKTKIIRIVKNLQT